MSGTVDGEIEDMRRLFERRRDRAVELINSIDGLSVVKPDGAFYLFINIKGVSNDSMDFSKKDFLGEVEGLLPVGPQGIAIWVPWKGGYY